jgi:hypothetical protein
MYQYRNCYISSNYAHILKNTKPSPDLLQHRYRYRYLKVLRIRNLFLQIRIQIRLFIELRIRIQFLKSYESGFGSDPNYLLFLLNFDF